MPTRKILQSRDNDSAIYATQGWASHFYALFKLRLGALIPRSVCLLVCQSVGLSALQKLKKITKLYKTSKNITKQYKMIKQGFPPFHV